MRILRDLQNVIASEYYKTRHDVAAKLFLFFPVLLTVAFIVYDLWDLSQEGYDGTNLWIYNIGRTLFGALAHIHQVGRQGPQIR